MTTTSSQPDLLATTIQAASLSELQIMLKDLRQMRIIRKQAGKKGLSTNGVRVELPVGCDSASAQEILKKLEIPTDAVVEYRENSKLFAWVRVFVGDSLYDGSFTTLTQNINH